ncbi:protein of unknown function [Shewanella benthica]|uniref:Uncharacterized protein n=1 Tax=Shewanella benthica TaxID=43661 RepID=A0A330M100_9GAMM|nr:protein of unknown function [Shewanella benthica]
MKHDFYAGSLSSKAPFNKSSLSSLDDLATHLAKLKRSKFAACEKLGILCRIVANPIKSN